MSQRPSHGQLIAAICHVSIDPPAWTRAFCSVGRSYAAGTSTLLQLKFHFSNMIVWLLLWLWYYALVATSLHRPNSAAFWRHRSQVLRRGSGRGARGEAV